MTKLKRSIFFTILLIFLCNIKVSAQDIYDFSYTGDVQTFTAPSKGIFKFEVWGAEGGGGYYANSRGGKGGYSSGFYELDAGQTIYIYVGGKGTIGNSGTIPGGYNGGGNGNVGSQKNFAGSGGGATDIRLVGGAWNDTNGLNSRVIVAGGGGGSGTHYQMLNGNFSGGAGGGQSGQNGFTASSGNPIGTGASQNSGGTSSQNGITIGKFGRGGDGLQATSSAGAGGGGYYGGGGSYCAGGGGGSGFVGSLISCNKEDPITISGSESIPSYDGKTTMIGNSGDGHAKISIISLESMLEAEDLDIIVTDNLYVYETTIPSDSTKTVLTHKYNNVIWSSGLGDVTLKIGQTHEVILMLENGEILVFNIIPNLGKAKLQEVSSPDYVIDFDSNKYHYEIEVENHITLFEPNVIPMDGVSFKFNTQNLNVGSNKIEIEASKEGYESTIYTFEVTRIYQEYTPSNTITFDYTGDVQTFIAPYTGVYFLETWGAQGGSGNASSPGGKGGYSSGYYQLETGDTLYVYVGGEGRTGTTNQPGGFNGGGTSGVGNYGKPAGSGGGATDIRLIGGAWNDTNGLNSRLIVAGGGGGGGHFYNTTAGNYAGGAGGGLNGENGFTMYSGNPIGTGATQTSGGKSSQNGITIGTFGRGGDGLKASSSAGAGGGGYYGGGGSYCAGGGGGSGFVGSLISCNGKDPITIPGNQMIPSHDGQGTMLGNAGNGYAKISFFNIEELDQITALTVDKGSLTPEFDKDTKEYYVTLDIKDQDITITATREKNIALVTGTGTFPISGGETKHPVIMTNIDGSITIYNINITKPSDPSADLAGFKVNGTLYENFDPSITTYDIEIPTELEKINLELIKQNPNQTIPTDTIYDFHENELSKTITVWSESNLANQVYIFNFTHKKTTTLKTLKITGGTLKQSFNPYVTDYTLDMLESQRELNIEATSWFKEAKITITEPRYVGIKDKTVTIKVELDDIPSTTYTLNINRLEEITENQNYNFPYTGDVQAFTASISGFYKLEVWGAQGGSGNASSPGGKGGYSSGYYYLETGETVYVYVGGKGRTGTTNQPGGFNGGGTSGIGNYKKPAGSGGGATDIRLIGGAWNDSEGLNSRLIVAGGGGGGGHFYNTTAGNYTGGAGGGLTGQNGFTMYSGNPVGTGATQTSGGKSPQNGITIGKFGRGGDGLKASSSAGAGGGGYYGGGGSYCAGGGGGSSYIDKVTSCNGEDPITITGNDAMPTHDGENLMLGNEGDGYAKITYIPIAMSDNFLDSISIDGNQIPNFEPWTLEYNITLSKTQTPIEISAVPKDINAKIMGVGKFNIPPGTSERTIIVGTAGKMTKTYTLKFEREPNDDPTPNNIILKTSHSYLCNPKDGLCDYTFDSSILDYNVTVPFQTTHITLEALLKSDYQTVIYRINDGDNKTVVTNLEFSLQSGDNIFEVEVIAEDNTESIVYTYHIFKDDKGNNNLKELTIIDPGNISLDFVNSQYEYNVTVPSSVTKLELNAIPEHPNATVKITGNENLKYGQNECFVTVTAENGNSLTYIIHIYREQSSNTYLSNLEVTDHFQNSVLLTPNFDKRINTYQAEVESTVDSVNVLATAEEGTVVGNGSYNLTSGKNEITITVTSVKGDTDIYTLTIIKKKNNNSNLLNIEVDGYELSPIFTKEEKNYTITIPKSVTSLNIKVTPEVETTSYTIRGNNNLTSAQNDIIITSIAEDKSYQIYKITVNKEVSDNNYLKDLTLTSGNEPLILNEPFHKETLEYTLDVDASLTSLTINALPEDENATVKGLGVHALMKGTNTINITVTSEDGTDRIYKIIVNRQKESDTTLESVLNNQGSEVTKMEDSSLGYDYLINVQYEINSIEITGIPSSNTSKVTGNKKYSLNTGDNDITLMVTAEDGTTQNYIVRVVRDKSNNDDLFFLFVEEGGLKPNFHETTIYYNVKVPHNTNLLHIEAEPEDENATVMILGNHNEDNKYEVDISDILTNESKEIEVVVTAENGDIKIYTLNITKQPETTENLSLLSLETNRGELTPIFNPDTLNYELTVPHEIEDITITATSFDETKTIEGLGTYPLKVGKNGIAIFVIGEDGVQKDYQIVVKREKSNDARLSNLEIKNQNLNPAFHRDTFLYNITTSDVLDFTTIETVEKEATYEIIGNENWTTGLNTVIIRVTAPDNKTSLDYQINVSKVPSTNRFLSSLEVEGYNLTPIFHKGVNFYTVEINNNVNSITITALPEDEKSTITGTGLKTVNTGENYFDVIVTSESGSTLTYQILVTKEKSDNFDLSSLYTNEGILTPEFKKEILDYHITVPFDTEEIEIMGTLEDENATVTGLKSYNLLYGDNEISIVVTSESGLTKTYRITVTREEINSAYLLDLQIKDYTLDTAFKKELLEYYVTVNNETTSLELTYKPEDPNATVVVSGNNDFHIGMNEVTLLVTANDTTTTKTYKIYVNRQMSTNNYLSNLTTSIGTLTPDFNKLITEYTLEVNSEVASIIIGATPESSSSKITSKLGEYALNIGENIIPIKVKSEIGITRTYTLKIIRKSNDNNNLSDLTVTNANTLLEMTPTFQKDTQEYSLTVSKDINYVNINATAEDPLAIITGAGFKALNSGTNRIEVNVTSESLLTKTYVLTIIKESDEIPLETITPSETSILLDIDEIKQITYTLDPPDTSFTSVKWESADESIATVDEFGNIKGIGYGTTKIYVVSTYDETIKGSIEVKVVRKKITSSIYDIKRFTEEEITNNPELQEHVIGIEPKTTLSDFLSNFDNDSETLHVYDLDGNEITDETLTISTSMTLKLIIDNKEYDELTIVVRGDINSDGVVNINDYNKLNSRLLKMIELNYIETQASDLNYDGIVNINDYSKLNSFLLKLLTTLN